MAVDQILEVQRLAQTALHKAQEAFSKQESHEDICGERYTNINEKLGSQEGTLKLINDSIKSVQLKQAELIGYHKALVVISIVVTIAVGIFKFTSGV